MKHRVTQYWSPGDSVVLREIWRDQIWSGRPYTLDEDTPSRRVIYAGEGVRWMRPVRLDGSPVQGRELAWTTRETRWPIEALRINTPRSHHSVLLLWTRGFGEFLKWYINLEDPLVRSAVGFDYLDNLLDIEVAPDLSAWNLKDEDELDDVVARGMMTFRKADFIRAVGSRVIEELEAKSPPFDEPWHLWGPDPSWDAPCLPDGWSDLRRTPPVVAMSTSSIRVSREASPDSTGNLMHSLPADNQRLAGRSPNHACPHPALGVDVASP